MREELMLEFTGFQEKHEWRACSYPGVVMLRVSLSLSLFSLPLLSSSWLPSLALVFLLNHRDMNLSLHCSGLVVWD